MASFMAKCAHGQSMRHSRVSVRGGTTTNANFEQDVEHGWWTPVEWSQILKGTNDLVANIPLDKRTFPKKHN